MRKTIGGLLAAALTVPLLSLAPSTAGAQTAEPRHANSRRLPALTPVARDALFRGLQRGQLSEAEYALERARSLFSLRKVRKEYGHVARPDSHAATMILRDLALRVRSMSEADARKAMAVLARPDDANDPTFNEFGIPPYSHPKKTNCSPTRGYCLHWADPADSTHRPDQTDTNPANGVPDFVDAAMTTMDKVWDDFKGLGFREPKKDGNSPNKGPDNKTDIYLADVGDAGVYGYCTTDDPNAFSGNYFYFDFSAYCVLDNDFHPSQFPAGTAVSNLQVTAAHEFFHAIQFAYDAADDGWLLEGTATSMEDVVYDDINDNQQFLLSSQFINPAIPLDFSNPNFGHPSFNLRYGAFAFWRFMTEFLAVAPDTQDDSVIQKIWTRVDASQSAAFGDEWSLKAAKKVAKDNYNTGFKKLFGNWGAALLFPEVFMEEGADYRTFIQTQTGGQWQGVPIKKTATLSNGSPASPWYSTKLDHLSSRFYRFLPGSGVGPEDELKITVNGPKRNKGTNAVLVVVNSGQVTVQFIKLNKKGDGTIKVPFPDQAYLIQQNASTRVTGCYQHPPFTSCSGQPRDDDLRFKGKGKLIDN